MKLTITSKFQPFSYDDLIKPYMQYKEVYEKAEADYANLAAQTEQWKNIANQTESPKAYAMYSKYSNALKEASDDFSHGMTIQNRGMLTSLKNRYASEIIPIAKAGEDLAKAETARMELKAKNPNAVFEKEKLSIDDFLDGKRYSNNYWDGTAAAARIAAKAEALGKALFSSPQSELYLNGQKYKITQLNGISPEELTTVLLDPENIKTEAGRKMRQIVEDELKNVNAENYSATGLNQITNIINSAMYAGLAKPTYNYVDNGEYVNKAQRQQIAISQANYNLAKEQWETEKDKSDKATGVKPYHTDSQGNKYYTNGKKSWVVDKNGVTTMEKTTNTNNASVGLQPKTLTNARSGKEQFNRSSKKIATINYDKVPDEYKNQIIDYLSQQNIKNDTDFTTDNITIYSDGEGGYRIVKKGDTLDSVTTGTPDANAGIGKG